jgi:hypothetical protein
MAFLGCGTSGVWEMLEGQYILDCWQHAVGIARLSAMADSPDTALDSPADDDPGSRLAAYMARSQTPLDILALLTLWIVVVPPGDFGHDAATGALIARLCLSGIYGIDMAIRTTLAHRHWHYLHTHQFHRCESCSASAWCGQCSSVGT